MATRRASTSATAAPAPSSTNDICPVCKTMRYLNKDLEFLINPECYHPMCANCVARIFSDGPNQCPYAGCHKTLRKKGFKSAYFGDLTVEREVDIRRRVAAVLNKVEDDFETLADYNEYLEWVETLTFDLISGTDAEKKAAEARLMEWEQAHRAEIERNRRLAKESEADRVARFEAEKEEARLRRAEAMQEDAAEKRKEQRLREDMLNGLASSDAGEAKQTLNRVLLKKRGQNRLQSAVGSLSDATSTGASGLSIRGLKQQKKRVVEDNKPYDPFGGLKLDMERYKMGPSEEYRNQWVDEARKKDDIVVGGYSADEYLGRAMFEAFSGLAVFIEDEKGPEKVATAEAALVASTGQTTQKMDVDDVF
ncbi:CDK-activating kinase assembly factor MAT1 [Colletotrichum scovillei]|uniref:RNA polymerase II transcription factor B subunit 3 n=1 Tax=Colletotrichum scovillei TaxID=1209932 RepID=A0A9P7QZR8_9PEZI|nr:CDK-activating kinase assembly factor MAT1 [Colletotrichum scovillei]KAF4784085.1 CDK-activating kinase assembly factor MAT1 [Colletotrichum scovillei]KAG7044971.1 CDK-activating kinase assembly factor MAT1 [Colletotrichum scovillei]KAG7049686.1 CDK-activating kinase assembly factor MAT1 [Colletotrichum scovillei]KAG7064425.1 CDK-activating kinase assembly factor MAT1 [Colletotrichum scovillei]